MTLSNFKNIVYQQDMVKNENAKKKKNENENASYSLGEDICSIYTWQQTHMKKDYPWLFIIDCIHKNLKLETTQMSINIWMNIQIVVYSYNEIILSSKKECNANTTAWMNPQNLTQSEKTKTK